ncbi:helix-turn-helix domain-containing protein [Sediminitomix flava]|uniref:AraC-like DNA-binding protein n=1 Tax=Sediminitomix flava TaxID=379075 RepID=A0A315ZG06_SEDFL|nr:AraC family transcriptional regulator [Sediminitomix flava]PWJ43684.1 AraC-like DNA-binding protein [Sediminitomix flava]
MKTIYLYQDSIQHTFDSLTKQIKGSKVEGLCFTVDNEIAQGEIFCYDNLDGIEITVNHFLSAEDLLFVEKVGESPQLIARFMRNSISEERKGLSEETTYARRGATLYSTLHPINVFTPKNELVEWIAVRISMDAWTKITQSTWPKLDEMVLSEDKWLVFESLSLQMEDCISEIFAAQYQKEAKIGFTLGHTFILMTHFLLQVLERKDEKDSIGLLTEDVASLFLIKEELLSNLSDPPSAEELTKKYGMSESRLRRNFKKLFGLPPHKYVLRERYQIAYREVKRGKKSISAIAYDLGFTDVSHFTKAFKKEFGVSPSKYRLK